MNERIRVLVSKAIIEIDDPYPGNPLNEELANMYIPDCFAEKFTKLIIQDVIGLVLDGEPNYKLLDDIKEHFGVEE